MVIVLIVVGWAVCGVFAYGGYFAHFQRHWPEIAERDYRTDMSMAVCLGIVGPIGLFAIAVTSGFFQHGFKFK